jgi:hypothetical protein
MMQLQYLERVLKIGFEGAQVSAVPASEAGDPISSPQRKLWVKYQPNVLSPRRGDIRTPPKIQEELLSLLRKHGVEYDERYICH